MTYCQMIQMYQCLFLEEFNENGRKKPRWRCSWIHRSGSDSLATYGGQEAELDGLNTTVSLRDKPSIHDAIEEKNLGNHQGRPANSCQKKFSSSQPHWSFLTFVSFVKIREKNLLSKLT